MTQERREGLLAICNRLKHEHPEWPQDRVVAEAKVIWQGALTTEEKERLGETGSIREQP